jgi:hypothetical protein
MELQVGFVTGYSLCTGGSVSMTSHAVAAAGAAAAAAAAACRQEVCVEQLLLLDTYA